MSVVGSVAVRVVPSFDGLHRNIGRTFSGAGAEAGRTFSGSLSSNITGVGRTIQSVGDRISSIGGTLTKSITLPAVGAAAAVGGITAALGWGRLKSIDSAQAQLRGLGYEANDVERITDQLIVALEGGMMDLGSATSAAAAAMAAGVEEGDELTHYIQMLDAAVVGGNGTFEEMNNIFSRTADLGYLNANNFDMMAQRMPGFSSAMQEHTGKSGEAFRDMLNNGEISLEEFLTVMDDFGGDMATEYAKSWEGMVENTKNYVGILGAELLGGVFEDSKLAIGEFIEFLSSDAAGEWAADMGVKIGNAFQTVIEWVTSAISWWTSLDSSTQKIIGTIGGIVVALGPVLLIIGKVISVVGGLIASLAYLANPITWIIAGIAALTAGLVWFFTQTEIGQAIVTTAWEWIQGAISAVVGWITGTAWPAIQSAWSGISSGAQWLWGIMQSVWGWIKDAISAVVDWAVGTAWPMIQSVWDGISTGAQVLYTILATIFTAVVAVFLVLGQAFVSIWTSYIKFVWDAITSIVRWVWTSIIKPIFGFIVSAFQALGTAFMWVWDNVIKPMWDMFVAIVRWVWTSIVQPIFRFIVQAFRNLGQGFMNVWDGVLKPVFNFLAAIIKWLWENVARPMFNSIGNAFQTMGTFLRNVWNNIIRPMIQRFGEVIRNLYTNWVQPALQRIREVWKGMADRIRDVWRNNIRPIFVALGDFVRNQLVDRISRAIDRIKDIWEGLKSAFAKPINWVINNVVNDGLIGAFNKVAGFIPGVSKISKVGTIGGYAKGGVPHEEWYVAGEEGPELIHRGRESHRVYTAEETRERLGVDSGVGVGGPGVFTREIAKRFATSDNVVSEWGRDKAGKAVSWARGALESAVNAVLEPLFEGLRSRPALQGQVGKFAIGAAEGVRDELLSWAKSDDDKAIAEGQYDGPFTANPGGFNRPMQGPITSRAGLRSYWGAFGNRHYGVDIGGPIGTAVRAMFSGVIRAISGGGNNRTVVMNHGGYDTAYMHMSAITRALGEQVKGGDVIARSGTAGSGPHGHFEYHPGGYYNPSMSAINGLIRDKGGLLYPGMNQVLNDTGRAEYVFNQRQFDNLNRIAARGGGTSEASLVGARVEMGKDGFATFVDGRVLVSMRDPKVARTASQSLARQGSRDRRAG